MNQARAVFTIFWVRTQFQEKEVQTKPHLVARTRGGAEVVKTSTNNNLIVAAIF